jgi:hypothetical protein
MPLVIKPHSVSVAAVTQAVGSDSVLQNPTLGSFGAPIACLVVPLAPSESYRIFGVVLEDPRKVFIEVASAASFPPNCAISFNGLTFWQKGYPEIHSNGDPADCAIFTMSRNQYPPIS